MTQPLTLTSLPLFPLGTVLFPGGLLPLRVFEVRYLDMVRKCQHAGAPFGVVGLTEGHEVRQAGAPEERFHDVGTLAVIEQLDSPQPGLIALRCRGVERFRILDRHRLPHGLWVADVEQLPADAQVAVPPDLAPVAAALARVQASLREREAEAGHALPPPAEARDDCGWVANRWCELLPAPVEFKQRMMALDNPLLRLELVGDVLARSGIVP
ncbi:LON peptidase substrate-binding domain-containing protein [Comamonas humi]